MPPRVSRAPRSRSRWRHPHRACSASATLATPGPTAARVRSVPRGATRRVRGCSRARPALPRRTPASPGRSSWQTAPHAPPIPPPSRGATTRPTAYANPGSRGPSVGPVRSARQARGARRGAPTSALSTASPPPVPARSQTVRASPGISGSTAGCASPASRTHTARAGTQASPAQQTPSPPPVERPSPTARASRPPQEPQGDRAPHAPRGPSAQAGLRRP
mmetsp:Transcript_67533/g.161580  ORF Transcript_67533/g.161580 Transcript_67533/m.161580 type:complete len:220 (+) Transcript_67533:337-996(+)